MRRTSNDQKHEFMCRVIENDIADTNIHAFCIFIYLFVVFIYCVYTRTSYMTWQINSIGWDNIKHEEDDDNHVVFILIRIYININKNDNIININIPHGTANSDASLWTKITIW